MKFYFFHLMPWKGTPRDFDRRYKTAWVDFPNSHYDPVKGQALYNQYLDEMEFAETVGFDGICVNEHHQSAYGNMPSPNIMAAALIRRTQRVKIAILGNAISLREHPLRVAEEIAMMDVLSGGRIISGFVRGIGCEYHTFSLDPTTSRDRFIEAHDLIYRAWTEEGPFEFQGEYYRLDHVNIWPRPLQTPPPIWIPSQGSGETIEWSAQHKYPYVQTYTAVQNVKRSFDMYREAAEKNGYTASPEQLGWALPIYVAETDEKAFAEAAPHIEFLITKLLNMPPEILLPPGYTSLESMRKVHAGTSNRGSLTARDIIENGMAIVGSPKTVTDRLKEYHKELQFGHLVGIMQITDLPHHLTMKNLELFAREVMPHLREL